MKLYISGPMSGIEDFNFPAFHDVATTLRQAGNEVINPAENFQGETHHPREEYMRLDIQKVLLAEGVVVLRGWEKSQGATTELRVALEIGLPIYRLRKDPTCTFGDYAVIDITEEVRQIIFGEDANTQPGEKQDIRTFETGATRDTDDGKLDYEGFLSPIVLKRFAEYMHKNRFLKDGSMRDSDNWQLGFSPEVYMKSLWRHFMDVWSNHRGWTDGDIQEELCAMLFNIQGYLHEILKEQTSQESVQESVGWQIWRRYQQEASS